MGRTRILTPKEANAVIEASKLSSLPIPEIVEKVKGAVPNKNRGKPATEKQMEALRKGMEALKVKRETLRLKKEEALRKVAAGEPLSDDEAPPKPAQPPPVIYVKAPRVDKGVKRSVPQYATREDFATFQNSVMETIKQSSAPAVEKIVEKEVPVEKIVDREVIREKVLTGSDMLDRLFFNK